MPKIKKIQQTEKENQAVLVFVGANSEQKNLVSKFARENHLDFRTYTESDWATLEEIDQYIQEEELSKQIINLPIGAANKEVSLDKLQENTIKKIIQIKNLNVNEAAKILKIGRATLYRKLEKYGMNLKKEREKIKQIKKKAA